MERNQIPDDATRGRSRSPSRERHRRRRSRNGSWDRRRSRSRSWSRERSYRRGSRSHSRSRSRDRSRGWRRHSRSPSPYRHGSPPAHHPPPWLHAGAPGGEVPPWHQPQHPYAPGPQAWQQPEGALPPGPYGREGPEYVSSRWDNPMHRSRSRGSDTDRDWEQYERRGRLHEVATASVFIKGLPFDADESDVHAAFSAFPNILSVKVLRDRATGHSKGSAFLDFASADDARVLMESEARHNTVLGGQPLYLDYASGAGAGGQGPANLDWICDMCSAVNFARRLECYHCSTARPPNPRRVTADPNEPSNVLKVSGLEPNTSEEALYQALSSCGHSIVDMRVIKDKYTGTPRGFAFVEFPTIAAAGSVMVACQGMVLQGQAMPLKICYAKAKDQLLGSAAPADGVPAAAAAAAGAAGGLGAAAVAAADHQAQPNAAAGPLGWKPKEFNPDGSVKEDKQQQQQQHVGPASASGQPGAAGAAGQASAGAAGPGPGSEGGGSGSAAAAAAAGVDAATIQAMTQAGFEYQAASGYWWDPKSGYFYDTATQLYYHHSTNAWYQYNADTGQYTAVGGDQQQQAQQQQPQVQPAPVQGPQPQQVSVAEKRRRAVIGGAAQYNPEGLLAAAALAEEREAEQRRIAAAKAARERQQLQQQQGKAGGGRGPANKLMPGKPGIGMLPGTGGVPAPPVAPPTAAVLAEGNLRGVVYRSKWSQQRAATQQAGQ